MQFLVLWTMQLGMYSRVMYLFYIHAMIYILCGGSPVGLTMCIRSRSIVHWTASFIFTMRPLDVSDYCDEMRFFFFSLFFFSSSSYFVLHLLLLLFIIFLGLAFSFLFFSLHIYVFSLCTYAILCRYLPCSIYKYTTINTINK